MAIDKAELQIQQDHINAIRKHYQPDSVTNTPTTSDKQQYTNRYMSIPPDAHQQAIDIASRYVKTYKNWQSVIRRAVYYGLPHLETSQEKVTAIKQGKNTGVIMPARICPAQNDMPTPCKQETCRNCVKWQAWQAEK